MKLIQINFEHFWMVQCPRKGYSRVELCFGCEYHRGFDYKNDKYYVRCTKD